MTEGCILTWAAIRFDLKAEDQVQLERYIFFQRRVEATQLM